MKIAQCLFAAVLCPFLPLLALADSRPAHQATQSRPIQLGTSGGNLNELFTCPEGTYCASGTLGALVKDGSVRLYILSNRHVLSRTAGGCQPGDAITQPGLIDAACSLGSGSTVATLTQCAAINFSGGNNKVDASIAEIIAGAVSTNGVILDIGQPSTSTVAPKTRLGVKKSGRTTGLTTGNPGHAAIEVYVEVDSPEIRKSLPRKIEGHTVKVVETGRAVAY